jgi:hypothetical protein
MSGRKFLQAPTGIESREKFSIFVLAPRLASLRRHFSLASVVALMALEGLGCFVQCPNYVWALIGRFRRKHFPGGRIYSVR